MNVETTFRLIDVDYVIDEEPVIRLFGTSEGRKVVALITNFTPYFYAIIDEKNKEKIKEELLKIKTENHYVTGLSEEKLYDRGKEAYCIKVLVNEPAGVYPISQEAGNIEGVLGKREADIKFAKRYLIDNNLRPTQKISVVGEEVINEKFRAQVIKAEKVSVIKDEEDWIPKTIAFDIETYSTNRRTSNPKKDEVIMISLYGDNHKEVLLTKPCKDKRTRVFPNEEAMLKEFNKIIKESLPDAIVTYNGDEYDLPYIKERMSNYKIKMDWGVDGSQLKLIQREDKSTARINGVMNIDLFQFVSRIISKNMKTNTLDLDSVANELLGENKVKNEWSAFFKAWDEGRTEELIDYSFNDAELTYKLYNNLLPLMIELSALSQQTIYDAIRGSYSQLVEGHLISESKLKKQLIPNKPGRGSVAERRSIPRYEGGYVYEPKPGIYQDIAVMDFRSLYPSIIVTYNICPTTINCSCCKSRYCQKKKGFIPEVVNEVLNRRSGIKKELKKKKDAILLARSNALKTIINATYGYLGFPNARWFCFECAERITEIGRNTIKETILKAEKEGFNIVYGDTDSIFLNSKEEKFRDKINSFLEKVNKDLPGVMELELEGFFKRGLFVTTRGEERGAKKKYALIDDDDKLIIKGFASIRGDWALIAKDTQVKVFNALLKDNDKEKAVSVINKTIEDLREGRAPLKELIIRTQLTRPISTYKSLGPHVAVAKRLLEYGYDVEPGMIIEYIITKGKGLIRDKARPVFEVSEKKLEYDDEYYINNQVVPSIRTIMDLLEINEKDTKKEQKKLNDFFK